jgi:hypothetical protein
MKFTEMVANSILQLIGSKKIKNLGPKTMPNDVTPKAKPLWPKFWKVYGKQCTAYGKKNKTKHGDVNTGRLILAVILFQRWCAKNHNMVAFSGKKYAKEQKKTMGNRIINVGKEFNNKLGVFVRSLDKKNVLTGTKILKEKIEKVYYEKGQYIIVTSSKIKVKKSDKTNVRDILLKKGFTKPGKYFVHSSSNGRLMIMDTRVSDNSFTIKKVLRFNEAQIQLILGYDDETIKERKKVIKAIGLYLKKKYVPNKDSAAGKHLLTAELNEPKRKIPVNFLETLSEEDTEKLSQFKKSLTDRTTNDLINTYNIDNIRSINTPIFQVELVKVIVDVVKTRGDKVLPLWEAIIDNPRQYLDPIKFNIDKIEE